jgi:multiple sugar transport system permease protein
MSAASGARRAARLTFIYVLLVLFGVVFVAPFAWLISTSLKPDSELMKSPPVWIPGKPQWDNYPKAFLWGYEPAVPPNATFAETMETMRDAVARGRAMQIPFVRWTLNTLLITGWSIVGTLLSCSLVAYGFSRIQWPGRNALFSVLLATMMLPMLVTLIPVMMLFRGLGWIGTMLPLIVPSFFAAPFYVFMLRQFFLTIPMDLSEAARIDGCSELAIYRRIILPLAKPALAIVALFTFVTVWNDFLGPLIYLSSESQYTLSLGLQQFVSQHSAEWQKLMAASTIMILPVIVIFFFAQRTFIEGISLTGLKG